MTIGGWGPGIGCAVVLAFASGCSSSATLRLRDGSTVSGRILRSNATTVWVRDPEVERAEGAGEPPAPTREVVGGEERGAVRREDIVDVTHPGNGEMFAGGALFMGAAALATMALAQERNDVGAVKAVYFGGGAIVLGVPSLIVTIDGVATYYGSRSRSRYATPPPLDPVDSDIDYTASDPKPMQGAKGARLGFEF